MDVSPVIEFGTLNTAIIDNFGVSSGSQPKIPRSSSNSNDALAITIETIIISALIFIIILAWLDVLRVWYEIVFPINPADAGRWDFLVNRVGFALFITALNLILIYIVYRIAQNFRTTC